MSSKCKILLVAAALVLIIGGLWWNSIVAKVVNSAQALVVTRINDNINGKLGVGDIEFSFFGTMTARQVVVYDSQQTIIGKSDKMLINYGIFDLFSGDVDLGSIKNITLENPVLLLTCKDGRWNWDNLLKTNTDQPLKFRGQVKVKQGTVALNSPDNRKLEAVTGQLDFTQYPAVSVDLTGNSGNNPLTVKGSWDFKGNGALEIKTAQVSLTELPLEQLAQSDFQLNGGLAKNLTISVKQQADELSISGEGAFDKATAGVAGYTLSEGSGKFSLAAGKLKLWESTVLVNGQKVAVDGIIGFAEKDLTVELAATAAAFDPAVLAGNSFQGPIAFQAKITGPATTPLAKGQFSIAQGSFGAITFSNANGDFSYSAGVLNIGGATASAWDGTLTLNGNVLPRNQRYDMIVNGQNVDSELLTNKDIRGRVNFDASLTGEGTGNSQAAGNFQMGEGTFSGVPFLGMTGDFVKQGSQVSFHNIIVRTLGGTFGAEGLSDGTIVRLKQIDSPTVHPRDILNKTISDKMKNIFR